MKTNYAEQYSSSYYFKQAEYDGEGLIWPRDRPHTMQWQLAPDDAARYLDAIADAPSRIMATSILASLILAARHGQGVSISRNKSKYVGLQVYNHAWTYSNALATLAELTRLGLIVEHRGKAWPEGKGVQTTLAGSEPFLAATARSKVVPLTKSTIILRGADKQIVGYKRRDVLALERDMLEINRALETADIRLDAPDINWDADFVSVPGMVKRGKRKGEAGLINPDQISLSRIFNETFQSGGRRYGHWCQGIGSDRRGQITIGGNTVELIDIGGAHIAILYAKRDFQLDFDPYDIADVERKVAKWALLILVNAADRNEARAALASRLYRIEFEDDDTHDSDIRPLARHFTEASRVMSACEARHSRIASAFCSGCGLACQFEESEVIGAAMKAALRQGIVTLPVHDELIASSGRDAGIVTDLMHQAWYDRFGFYAFI